MTAARLTHWAVILAIAFCTSISHAQTVPDCRAVVPGFQDIDDLNKTPGTITSEDFKAKLAKIDADFGSLVPTPEQLANARGQLAEGRKQLAGLQGEMEKMIERRKILERLVAQSMDLMAHTPNNPGSTSYLYCQSVSQLAAANYEIQQDSNLLQLVGRMLSYVASWK